jgi:hypothetical protein
MSCLHVIARIFIFGYLMNISQLHRLYHFEVIVILLHSSGP